MISLETVLIYKATTFLWKLTFGHSNMYSTSGFIWLDGKVSESEARFFQTFSQHWIYREGFLFTVGHFDEWEIMHELRYILRFLHVKGRGEIDWRHNGVSFFGLRLEGSNVVISKVSNTKLV